MPPRFAPILRKAMTGTFPRIRTVATGERSRRDKAWFRFLSWTISHTGETALATDHFKSRVLPFLTHLLAAVTRTPPAYDAVPASATPRRASFHWSQLWRTQIRREFDPAICQCGHV